MRFVKIIVKSFNVWRRQSICQSPSPYLGNRKNYPGLSRTKVVCLTKSGTNRIMSSLILSRSNIYALLFFKYYQRSQIENTVVRPSRICPKNWPQSVRTDDAEKNYPTRAESRSSTEHVPFYSSRMLWFYYCRYFNDA